MKFGGKEMEEHLGEVVGAEKYYQNMSYGILKE